MREGFRCRYGTAWKVASITVVLVLCLGCAQGADVPEVALVLGVLFDHTGSLGDFGRTGDDGVRLAVEHLGAEGEGIKVTMVSADGATNVESAVLEARRLVTEHDVHAIIGPLGSAAALAVARDVTIPAGIPLISPTATSPGLTTLEDQGLVFRTTASDAAQAPILARLAIAEGYRRLGVLYQDDTYGRGLSEAFARLFTGAVTRVAVAPGKASYRTELERAAADGAEALVAMTYVPEATIYLREARELGLFDRFLFVDATASTDLPRILGPEMLEGMKGTAPEGAVPELGARSSVPTTSAFASAFEARFERPPVSGLEASAYDIAVCLGLAAGRAGDNVGAKLRVALPDVCGGTGVVLGPGPESVAEALATAKRGDAVNYDGASNAMEWDDAGDLATGSVVIWQFTDGAITEVERVRFGASG